MPQAITSPRRDDSTGRNTAASLGPSFAAPTRGLITLPPCTSWSYWRMTHSLLAMLRDERRLRSVVLGSRAVGNALCGVPGAAVDALSAALGMPRRACPTAPLLAGR